MKKAALIFIIITSIISCNDISKSEFNRLTDEISLLRDSISTLSSSNDNFIALPFSKLASLFNSDSLTFNSSIRDLGFKSDNNLLYFKNGFNPETKNIGIGNYMFHNIPMIVRTFDVDWLIYTFPIDRLSYYKTAVLEKGQFTVLYEQESIYNDKYDINYITEVYVDKINKLEYQLSYYINFGKLRIAKRDY